MAWKAPAAAVTAAIVPFFVACSSLMALGPLGGFTQSISYVHSNGLITYLSDL